MKAAEVKAIIVGEKIPLLVGKEGKVISIFQNTVNIYLGKQLITITVKNVFSPNNVNLDLLEFLERIKDFREKVIPEDTVKVFNEYINFQKSGLVIRITGSRFFSVIDELRKLSKVCRGLGTNELRLIAQKYIKIASLVSKGINKGFSPYIIEGSLAIYDSLRNPGKHKIVLPNKALKYVGLGDGLTPAYDDFLSGLLGTLSSLFFVRNSEFLFILRNNSFSNTTFISQHLLSSMSKGEVNNLILDIVSAYCRKELKVLLDKLMDFLQLGHSSGMYSGIGSVIALLLDSLLHGESPWPSSALEKFLNDLLNYV